MKIMLTLKNIEGDFFIIKHKDVSLVKSHGDKTVFTIRGIEKPLVCDINYFDVIQAMKKKQISKICSKCGSLKIDF